MAHGTSKAAFSAAVSARALISVRARVLGSLTHDGMSPQRTRRNSRATLQSRRAMRTGCVDAML